MPEETQAPAEQDKPDAPEGAPEEGQAPQPDIAELQRSYDELRSKFNERDTELSQYRDFYGQLADPETQAEALRALGLELEDEEEDEEEYQDPDEVLAQRLEGIEGYLSQQEEAAAEAELESLEEEFLVQSLDDLQKRHGNLTDEEAQAIVNLAYAYPDEQGLPDVAAAHEAFTAASKAAQQRYLASKKGEQVEKGAAGLENIDMSDSEARVKAAAALIDAESSE